MRPPAMSASESSPLPRKSGGAEQSYMEVVSNVPQGSMDFWLAKEHDIQSTTEALSLPILTSLTSTPNARTNASSPGTAGWTHDSPNMSMGSSIRLSNDGDGESAVAEGDDAISLMGRGAPELVMPSLAMPKRRPFTNRGKMMGRLKICVAGRKGVGKTSLIRAIVDQCEDIVQVDPLSMAPVCTRLKSDGMSKRKRVDTTSQVTEIMASTKPYPLWWSGDLHQEQNTRKRRSVVDGVLDRNLCFVDTPGFLTRNTTQVTSFDSGDEVASEFVLDYIEEQLWKTETSVDMNSSDRLNMVSGRGSAIVDVVLFLFSEERFLQEELNMFLRLSALTNVVPLLGKSDSLSSSELTAIKAKVIQGLHSVKRPLQPFLFGHATQTLLDSLTSREPTVEDSNDDINDAFIPEKNRESESKSSSGAAPLQPFAISSLQGADTDEMDASLLMSSAYLSSLLNSELPALIEHLFDPEHMLWLRHNAALKFVAWREKGVVAVQSSLHDSSVEMDCESPHHVRMQTFEARTLQRRHTNKEIGAPVLSLSFESGRQGVLDHMNGTQRAHWLLRRISEEIAVGNIGVLAPPEPPGLLSAREQFEERRSVRQVNRGEVAAWARRGKGGKVRVSQVDPSDPLGLVKLWDGWKALFTCVGVGALGGAIYAVITTRGWYATWGATGARS